ncbi:hypothetical protein HK101_005325, partial [Irineochytrium annulatum]
MRTHFPRAKMRPGFEREKDRQTTLDGDSDGDSIDPQEQEPYKEPPSAPRLPAGRITLHARTSQALYKSPDSALLAASYMEEDSAEDWGKDRGLPQSTRNLTPQHMLKFLSSNVPTDIPAAPEVKLTSSKLVSGHLPLDEDDDLNPFVAPVDRVIGRITTIGSLTGEPVKVEQEAGLHMRGRHVVMSSGGGEDDAGNGADDVQHVLEAEADQEMTPSAEAGVQTREADKPAEVAESSPDIPIMDRIRNPPSTMAGEVEVFSQIVAEAVEELVELSITPPAIGEKTPPGRTHDYVSVGGADEEAVVKEAEDFDVADTTPEVNFEREQTAPATSTLQVEVDELAEEPVADAEVTDDVYLEDNKGPFDIRPVSDLRLEQEATFELASQTSAADELAETHALVTDRGMVDETHLDDDSGPLDIAALDATPLADVEITAYGRGAAIVVEMREGSGTRAPRLVSSVMSYVKSPTPPTFDNSAIEAEEQEELADGGAADARILREGVEDANLEGVNVLRGLSNVVSVKVGTPAKGKGPFGGDGFGFVMKSRHRSSSHSFVREEIPVVGAEASMSIIETKGPGSCDDVSSIERMDVGDASGVEMLEDAADEQEGDLGGFLPVWKGKRVCDTGSRHRVTEGSGFRSEYSAAAGNKVATAEPQAPQYTASKIAAFDGVKEMGMKLKRIYLAAESPVHIVPSSEEDGFDGADDVHYEVEAEVEREIARSAEPGVQTREVDEPTEVAESNTDGSTMDKTRHPPSTMEGEAEISRIAVEVVEEVVELSITPLAIGDETPPSAYVPPAELLEALVTDVGQMDDYDAAGRTDEGDVLNEAAELDAGDTPPDVDLERKQHTSAASTPQAKVDELADEEKPVVDAEVADDVHLEDSSGLLDIGPQSDLRPEEGTTFESASQTSAADELAETDGLVTDSGMIDKAHLDDDSGPLDIAALDATLSADVEITTYGREAATVDETREAFDTQVAPLMSSMMSSAGSLTPPTFDNSAIEAEEQEEPTDARILRDGVEDASFEGVDGLRGVSNVVGVNVASAANRNEPFGGDGFGFRIERRHRPSSHSFVQTGSPIVEADASMIEIKGLGSCDISNIERIDVGDVSGVEVLEDAADKQEGGDLGGGLRVWKGNRVGDTGSRHWVVEGGGLRSDYSATAGNGVAAAKPELPQSGTSNTTALADVEEMGIRLEKIHLVAESPEISGGILHDFDAFVEMKRLL